MEKQTTWRLTLLDELSIHNCEERKDYAEG